MAKIPTALARKRAVDRVIEVMRAELANELASLNTEATGGDLYLPAPPLNAYRRAPADPTHILPDNQDIIVYVYPAGPRGLVSRGSSGVTRANEQRQWTLEVTLACRAALSEEVDLDGYPITSGERLWVRSDLYTGAIIETIEKYACEGEAIHFIEMSDDMAALFWDGQRKMYGISTAKFDITQITSAPLRRKLP